MAAISSRGRWARGSPDTLMSDDPLQYYPAHVWSKLYELARETVDIVKDIIK